MRSSPIHLFLIILIFGASSVLALGPEQHREVALRQIGHELLWHSADSSSRVLPVQRLHGQYLIRFSAPLQIVPDSLVLISDRVLEAAKLGLHYSVEVLSCDSNAVVYSFERSPEAHHNIIPCLGRNLERACYYLRISIAELEMRESDPIQMEADTESSFLWLYGVLILGLVLGLRIWWRGARPKSNSQEEEWLSFGSLKFHPQQMLLKTRDNQFELSAKEADLLAILLKHPNQTLAREFILQEVWGDDGDYVGRTLDVFISKLRKKLEADPQLKIINARGVGYRLVVGTS